MGYLIKKSRPICQWSEYKTKATKNYRLSPVNHGTGQGVRVESIREQNS